ncbi:hypothetical protein CFP56_015640 [Quercus suber]|uniref:Uncharacterized protein n=1 Tax=Quercus suber TaxID=58331 RepID=A0AAW0KS02_QUESU
MKSKLKSRPAEMWVQDKS